jgi:4-hydroxy-3-polyprenylbenzoate decarboxylase
MLPMLRTEMSKKPKAVSRAPCQEVVQTGATSISAGCRCDQLAGEAAPQNTWPLV